MQTNSIRDFDDISTAANLDTSVEVSFVPNNNLSTIFFLFIFILIWIVVTIIVGLFLLLFIFT